MKTTAYIVYLKALEGRFALPEEETTERNLLAHHFGRNFKNYGLLTKEQLKLKLYHHTKVLKEDGVIGKVKPDALKESYTRKQAKLEVYGEKGLSFELKGFQYKTMEVKYDEDCDDYLYRVVNLDNGNETFFWQNFIKKNITYYW